MIIDYFRTASSTASTPVRDLEDRSHTPTSPTLNLSHADDTDSDIESLLLDNNDLNQSLNMAIKPNTISSSLNSTNLMQSYPILSNLQKSNLI